MAKRDDLEDRVQAIENKQAIEDGIHSWIKTVCITATGIFSTFCLWLGSFVYDRFDAIKVAIQAFLNASQK